jgi:HEPN domain-containing protein
VFVSRKIPHPYTHDINALLSGLEQHRVGIPGPLWDAVTLTSFASDARYPGTTVPVTQAEYEEAIRLASEILSWAENLAE